MSSLADIIVQALKNFLELLVEPITGFIGKFAHKLLTKMVGTPSPNAVFKAPTNDPWPGIYEYYWEVIVPLVLFLWALSIGLVIFFESTNYLFSNYHRSKLKKRAFSGLLGVLSWWWIAAISLRFTDALAGFLVPNLSEITFFQTLSIAGLGVLGVVLSLTVDLVLFIVIGALYFIREIVLYLFVLMMPLLIVFWIPGVGPFTLVSRFMKRLAGFYVPFLFMTVPVALLFRIAEIFGGSFSLDVGGVGAWLAALVIPIVAVVSPFFLFWQAGALFFMADRASHHTSGSRARDRVEFAGTTAQTGRQGGRNFVRGTQGRPAVRSDGQFLLESGDSRAHAVGTRLSAAGSRLRTRVSGTSTSDGGSKANSESEDSSDSSDRSKPSERPRSSKRKSRESSFDLLRDYPTDDLWSGSEGDDEPDDSDDDNPRYIH